MPELPEVETVRLGLAPVLVGNSFASVEQRRPDLRFPLPKHFAQRLQGRKVDALDRRAKYLLARLDDGEVLVMHLGMTGRFSIDQANGKTLELGEFEDEQKPAPKHEHIVFHLADGTAVRYSDTRRFGLMDLIPGKTLPAHALFEGLGNIYACEALFRAGISPLRLAGTLATKTGKPTKAIDALVKAVKAVLGEAIKAGGSSLRDYKRADGRLGRFQHSFKVYGREGKPCCKKGCRDTVRRIVQSGRSTFYCPNCQR